ncbi:hypothetical protein BDN70DRAFT_884421 [Pholiota conissans]|uniref:histidine kinase n=1 Tax=Pholiota conissans TaxID=109636 RepID=A0A9P6CW34_9AGAR|nr:hypothetical protein BDN70DRAFT_884421 [Pholiota conissans]
MARNVHKSIGVDNKPPIGLFGIGVMPQWLKPFHPSVTPPWSDPLPSFPPSLNEEKDNHSSNPAVHTSMSSTAFESPLPPPAVYSSSRSSQNRAQRRSRFSAFAVFWDDFKKRIGTGSAPSSSSVQGESENGFNQQKVDTSETPDVVDEVVVDRLWTEELKSSVSHSDHGGGEKSGGSNQHKEVNSDHESVVYEGCWSRNAALAYVRWRAWPFILEIFNSRFIDPKSEAHYAQESWFIKKSLALWASLWLILNWILGCVFIPRNPVGQLDKIFYFGVSVAETLIRLMIMYDWPRDRQLLYQVFLVVSIWCCISCGFYSNMPNCQGKDFITTFYYTTGLQTIALFGLRLNRFPAALGALIFFIFSSIAIIPVRHSWSRSMISFLVFQAFLIYVHYVSESAERRLYTLRDQLKIQFKATQKARVNEQKASDSKRRLTSLYLILNIVLAVQNMEASGTIARDQEIEFNALCGSLSMMSKVLNDVLDFNRMDSGKFESMSRPYGFHQVMRSLFVPLQLATDARGLKFETELDPNIDIVARQAAYKATGESMEAIQRHIHEHPDVVGIVTGDETRLRQIITNLASNACKFTPTGGRLSIKTRLMLPALPPDVDPLKVVENDYVNGSLDFIDKPRPLSKDFLTQHDIAHGKHAAPMDWIVVRIEVSDTGYGIKPSDMAQSKLFSAFNQTEQGRQQGGKGTGLGLALVRQIVKLSGGRLGVQSKVGEGSTFWVELPLGVGSKTFVTAGPDLPEHSSSSDIATLHRANKRLKSPSCADSVIMAVDAAGLKMSRKVSMTAQNSAAMQGIMEQGGRVELVLKQRRPKAEGGPTPSGVENQLLSTDLPLDSVLTPLNQSSSSSEASPTTTSPRALAPPTPESTAEEHTSEHPPTPSSSGKATPLQRPTYLRLPTPPTFSMDDNRPPDTGNLGEMKRSPSSEQSASNLRMFDSNFPRGSPSGSFTASSNEPALPVLVVDDDPLTRTLMKRILTRLGCQVSCAENGEVALEMILGQRISVGATPSSDLSAHPGPILEQLSEQLPFDPEGKFAVVFLDNQMPVMSGLKAARKLRELGRTDFVVGVTGNALLSDQEEYLEAGVDKVLTKPVLERSLRDTLIQAEERRKDEKSSPRRTS